MGLVPFVPAVEREGGGPMRLGADVEGGGVRFALFSGAAEVGRGLPSTGSGTPLAN